MMWLIIAIKPGHVNLKMYNGGMYTLATSVIGMPIMSLQNGHAVASVRGLLINSATLELVAFYCDDPRYRKQQAVLLMQDIREVTQSGIIIDRPEDIEDIAEIVRIQEIATQKFELIGLAVVTETEHKLGSVEDYAIDTTTFMVTKLYIKQTVIKNFFSSNLVIDRTQIIDITPKRITVRDATVKESAMAGQPAPTEPA